MKNLFQSSSARLRGSLLLAGLFCFAASQVHAQNYSAYYTIQPNATGTAVVHTISWAALDSQYAGAVYDSAGTPLVNEGLRDKINRGTPYGNNASELDRVDLMVGGQYTFSNTANGGSATTEIGYRHTSNGGPPILNNSTRVFYDNPLNLTLTHTTPALATPKWDDIGDFASRGDLTYGVGVLGVTGFRTANPNGTGAQFTKVGIYTDEDVSAGDPGVLGSTFAYDDLGLLLSGFADPVGNFSEAPNKGYIQVVIPSPAGDAASEFVAVTGRYNVGTFASNLAIQVVVTTDPNYVPKLAVSGDFNGSVSSGATPAVNAADLTVATGNFTGAASVTAPFLAKYYRTGDTNDDLDVDNADLGVVIGAYSPAVASPTLANLTYDAATGNVKLNAATAAGAIITSFQISNTAGTFVPGSYAGPTFGGTYQNVTTTVIGNSDTTLTGATGQVNLGNVFPTGMTLPQLTAYLTTAVYTGTAGSGQQQLALTLAPTLSSIVDNQSGGPINTNTLVTYTVTFNGDMNASTVSAADFGNAGTSAVTIGTVTETSPGVFAVQATPTSAGTLILSVNANAVLENDAGAILFTGSAIPDDTTITVNAPVAAVDHFAISAIGSPQTVGTAITGITITAQDVSNATATGFTGTVTFGGTGGFSGTSASFVAGVLSGVSVTPTVAGSNLTLTVDDDGGPSIGSTTIVTVQTVFTAWSGGAGANLDTNGDGVKNGAAWALNAASPNVNAIGLLPSISNTDPNFFIFTFNRSDAANADANTAITVEYGNDLIGWTTAVHDGTDVVITVTPGSPTDGVEVKLRRSVLAPTGKLFTQLKVVITP